MSTPSTQTTPAAPAAPALPAAKAKAPGPRYWVQHATHYSYQQLVSLSQQYLHLSPRDFDYQRTEAHRITIDPAAEDGGIGTDYFGNCTRYATITTPHRKILVQAESTVVLSPRLTLAEIAVSPAWEKVRDMMVHPRGDAALDAVRYMSTSPHVSCSAVLADYGRLSFLPGRQLLEAALSLTQRIFDDFEYDGTATDISTPLDEVLRLKRGVCQDFAQLMIGCMRSLGLPARYVSGYVLTHPPPGQPRMIGADASHAWVSVYCPELGWVDFDPTNRSLVQSEHITLGWGRDFSDVTPLRGVVLGGGDHDLVVNVTVTPLDAD